jgi:hypothetical protein
LQALVERIGARLGKYLERRGILAPDVETSYLALDPDSEEDALPDLQGHSNRMRGWIERQHGWHKSRLANVRFVAVTATRFPSRSAPYASYVISKAVIPVSPMRKHRWKALRIEWRTPGSVRGIRKPAAILLAGVGCPLSAFAGRARTCNRWG